jgi:hypothetical protein
VEKTNIESATVVGSVHAGDRTDARLTEAARRCSSWALNTGNRKFLMKRLLLQSATHGIALALGFGLGVYFLPILTAPSSPEESQLSAAAEDAVYSAEFEQDLRGNDFLHWGTGSISLTPARIVHQGELSPGPNYIVYLVPEFVEHEDEFLPLKAKSQAIGLVKSFDGFDLAIPEGVDINAYTTVLVWCEAFSEKPSPLGSGGTECGGWALAAARAFR